MLKGILVHKVKGNSEWFRRNRLLWRGFFFTTLTAVCLATCGLTGCGETAKPVVSTASGQVSSYFSGPFSVGGSDIAKSVATFDHTAMRVGVSAFAARNGAEIPTQIISGSFAPAPTGFLSITEDLAPTQSGIPASQNPPLTGAWAVEIPGAGALANLLNIKNSIGGNPSLGAAPAAMADNTSCPEFPNPVSFLYVTVPNANLTMDTADYGGVTLTSQGSAVTFRTQPYLIGVPQQPGFNVTGGCSQSNLGALVAYPLNSFGTPSNLELISIGQSGLLVSSFNRGGTGNSAGAFGGTTGVLGVVQPQGAADVSAVTKAQYNGFLYAPLNRVPEDYDITVLASAFGDNTATSPACSALQTSITANQGQGSGNISALPSPNSLYGGEFLVSTSAGMTNDPSGATGSENCDVVIDLGDQDSSASGVFPNATLFIGSNFPPFSATQPWTCGSSTPCAVSFPAAAVVGQVHGQYVVFVVASAATTPPARLPDQFGNSFAQPIGIYLFQKTQ